jgi:hypothetical protein
MHMKIASSGRIVAYPDKTAFLGDYFRIAGDSTGIPSRGIKNDRVLDEFQSS